MKEEADELWPGRERGPVVELLQHKDLKLGGHSPAGIIKRRSATTQEAITAGSLVNANHK